MQPLFSAIFLRGAYSPFSSLEFSSRGFLVNDYDEDSGKDRQNLRDNQTHESHPEANKGFVSKSVTRTIDSEDSIQAEMSECVLKCKSVFKCRICPRIVCLSEETLLAHLKSKRHARSKKLLAEGRLKLMLNSDGDIEEEEETHAERHARTVALVQPKKKNKGRQRQSKRRRMCRKCTVVVMEARTILHRKAKEKKKQNRGLKGDLLPILGTRIWLKVLDE